MKFLEAVDASIAIIGVGNNNKFGHPNDTVLERLELGETKIYRTDKMGEISIRSDGIKINIMFKVLYKNNNSGK